VREIRTLRSTWRGLETWLERSSPEAGAPVPDPTTEEAVQAWHAPATGERGGQLIYSAIAIETGLALRLVFHQPLRQTEGMLRSIVDALGVEIAIPDHTTLSRRGGGLTILPRRTGRDEPLHLLVDSTGLKIYGEGEWLDQKHGIRRGARVLC
jgi:Transposase DDE domain